MLSGLIHPPGATSLMLLGIFSLCAAPFIVRTNSPDMRLGSAQHMGGRDRHAEAMYSEEVFFVTFVLFLLAR